MHDSFAEAMTVCAGHARACGPFLALAGNPSRARWGGASPPCGGSSRTAFSTDAKLQVSGTFSSKKVSDSRNTNFNAVFAESIQANQVVSKATVKPLLGRDLAGNASSTTLNLMQPGTFYGDRLTDFDLRLARVQKFGSRKLLVGVDIYNVLNAPTPISYNQTYTTTPATAATAWLAPQSVLQARFAKISAQFDF